MRSKLLNLKCLINCSNKNKENPQPEQGPLITIKLNEAEEVLTASNGQQNRVLSELFFQMNYDTGEYKKIKKFKPLIS